MLHARSSTHNQPSAPSPSPAPLVLPLRCLARALHLPIPTLPDPNDREQACPTQPVPTPTVVQRPARWRPMPSASYHPSPSPINATSNGILARHMMRLQPFSALSPFPCALSTPCRNAMIQRRALCNCVPMRAIFGRFLLYAPTRSAVRPAILCRACSYTFSLTTLVRILTASFRFQDERQTQCLLVSPSPPFTHAGPPPPRARARDWGSAASAPAPRPHSGGRAASQAWPASSAGART